tara:strand:- start:23428 stop:24207 length:780 start_codon:yes stop_codon:yes gene_type:complete
MLEQKSISNFQKFLEQEYLKRLGKNSSYSIRAFAKDININDSTLSQILRGKRNLSKKKQEEIGLKLGLSLAALRKIQGEAAAGKIPYKILREDQYDVVANWYYDVILEMVDLDNFRLDAKWIAKKLEISTNEATLALQKLIRSNYLICDDKGKWHNNLKNITSAEDNDFDHIALQNFQTQMRERAIASIKNDGAKDKNHSSYTVAMDQDLFPEIKEEIKIFRRKIAELIEEKSKKRDCVGNLQISFFSNTKTIQGDNNE